MTLDRWRKSNGNADGLRDIVSKVYDRLTDEFGKEIDRRLEALRVGESLAVAIVFTDRQGSAIWELRSAVVPPDASFEPCDPEVDQWTIYGPKEERHCNMEEKI